MSTATAIGISLETGCNYDDECAVISRSMMSTMDSGKYDRCAVMEIPASLEEWRSEHRTARKAARRAANRGYVAAPLKREFRADDIYAINTSKAHRQGRPMNPAYLERQEFSPLPEYRCERHAIRTSGVYLGCGDLVGYLVMYRAGDLALVSQILGHGSHERFEIMYRLFEYAVAREIDAGPGVMVYNRFDSGTPGLQERKVRYGFREEPVEWLP